MMRSFRHGLTVVGLASLCACGISVGFDIAKDFEVVTVAESVSITKPIDLSQQSEINSVKGVIEGLSIDSINLSASDFDPASQATRLNGSVSLRDADAPSDGSADVLIGDIHDFALTPDATLLVKGNAKADDLLINEFKASKSFSIVLTGQADATAKFTLHAAMHMSVTVL